MTTSERKLTHASNVTIYPVGTGSDPLLFESLQDALDFSRITQRMIWAIVSDEPENVYRIYPGGRNELHNARRQSDEE
jgi:hypothetical protein